MSNEITQEELDEILHSLDILASIPWGGLAAHARAKNEGVQIGESFRGSLFDALVMKKEKPQGRDEIIKDLLSEIANRFPVCDHCHESVKKLLLSVNYIQSIIAHGYELTAKGGLTQ